MLFFFLLGFTICCICYYIVISRTLDLTSSDAFPTFPTPPTTPTLLLVTITFTLYLALTLALCSDSRSLLRSLLHYSATALTPEHLSIATPTLTITYSIYPVLTTTINKSYLAMYFSSLNIDVFNSSLTIDCYSSPTSSPTPSLTVVSDIRNLGQPIHWSVAQHIIS